MDKANHVLALPALERAGRLGADGTYSTINGMGIRWTDAHDAVHIAVAADAAPGVRLIWTVCMREVPQGEAYLSNAVRGICETCLWRARRLRIIR